MTEFPIIIILPPGYEEPIHTIINIPGIWDLPPEITKPLESALIDLSIVIQEDFPDKCQTRNTQSGG